ncbi:double-stranded dna repair protein rad50, partial [Lasius niger]
MKRELKRIKSREEDWKKERREWKDKIEELEGKME